MLSFLCYQFDYDLQQFKKTLYLPIFPISIKYGNYQMTDNIRQFSDVIDNQAIHIKIQVYSSEDIDQEYSDLSFAEERVIEHQEEYHLLFDQEIILLNHFPDKSAPNSPQVPSYQQIMAIIQAIRTKYHQLSLRQIINMLYKTKCSLYTQQQDLQKKVAFNSQAQKFRYFLQCKYAAKSFIQFEYGINRMRKLLSRDDIHLQISSNQYNDIINRLFYSSFKRLEEFVYMKCQEELDQYKKSKGVLCKFDLRGLIELVRYCRRILDPEDIHTLFKIIKSTANNQRLKLYKRPATHLYKNIVRHINNRRKRGEGQSKNINNTTFVEEGLYHMQHLKKKDFTQRTQDLLQYIDLQQEFKRQLQFNKQILDNFLDLYIKQPNSLINISKTLKSKYPSLQNYQSFSQSFLKHQLQDIIIQTINRIKQQSQRPQCIQKGITFKKLVSLDGQHIKLILQSCQAGYLRATICQYYKVTKFDIDLLICTILQINQFVNKIDHDKIIQNLKITKEINSICRQQYEFAGKRRKILVYKKKRPPKRKPYPAFF